MTKTEAIPILERTKRCMDINEVIEALELALTALRPVSREQLDVVINSLKLRLENNEENGVVYIPKFAIEKMIERLEAIKNG